MTITIRRTFRAANKFVEHANRRGTRQGRGFSCIISLSCASHGTAAVQIDGEAKKRGSTVEGRTKGRKFLVWGTCIGDKIGFSTPAVTYIVVSSGEGFRETRDESSSENFSEEVSCMVRSWRNQRIIFRILAYRTFIIVFFPFFNNYIFIFNINICITM